MESSVKIKICGIVDEKTAKYTALTGAHYIGLVFEKSSPRYVTVAQAKKLSRVIREAGSTPVAIFTEHDVEQMKTICRECQIDVVKLHGVRSRQDHVLLPQELKRIYVMPNASNKDYNENIDEQLKKLNSSRDYLMFDTRGVGGLVDSTLVQQYKKQYKVFVAGNISEENVIDIIKDTNPYAVDASSSLESSPGVKDIDKIRTFVQTVQKYSRYYGQFGGCYVPELLVTPLAHLAEYFEAAINDAEFIREYQSLLTQYAGRETPLTEVKNFSKAVNGPRLLLKREDLLHTGAHKINNALGQCLLAKKMGKTRIIAETGAGQHGVATATACAHLGLECEIFMGEEDIKRQAPNVAKMKLLGAKVNPVSAGSKTLREAVNAALRDYALNYQDTHYCIGSALGPYPYPQMVAYFQRVIGIETKKQCLEQFGRLPDQVIACVGGGSNAIGMFQAFLTGGDSPNLIGVEGGGKGKALGQHAARFNGGRPGVLHGCYSMLLQDDQGQTAATHSISAGLDYPMVGPQHAELHQAGRVDYVSVNDEQVLCAFKLLAQTEGIIPALESSHALAHFIKIAPTLEPDAIVVICLSGRGDKDLPQLVDAGLC